MKIALIAPTGNIGSEIAREALRRGHHVTGLVRTARALPAGLEGVELRVVDLFDQAALGNALRGHDVVASAFGPSPEAPEQVVAATRALVAGTRAAQLKRLIVVGGAGSLEVAPGVQLVDIPEFPAAYKAVALAHRTAFEQLREVSDLDWTFFAPAALIGPGPKVGGYRVGVRALLGNAAGESRISYPDYADAFVSELEQAKHRKEIVTVAY